MANSLQATDNEPQKTYYPAAAYRSLVVSHYLNGNPPDRTGHLRKIPDRSTEQVLRGPALVQCRRTGRRPTTHEAQLKRSEVGRRDGVGVIRVSPGRCQLAGGRMRARHATNLPRSPGRRTADLHGRSRRFERERIATGPNRAGSGWLTHSLTHTFFAIPRYGAGRPRLTPDWSGLAVRPLDGPAAAAIRRSGRKSPATRSDRCGHPRRAPDPICERY